MTTRPLRPPAPGTAPEETFPDMPPREDMQNPIHLYIPGCLAALIRFLGLPDTTIVISEIPVGWTHSQSAGVLKPDLLVAFGVDRENIFRREGYAIQEQGKPPDFVLEVASRSTGRRDYQAKREGYASYGVPEYWRFDSTGGRIYPAGLAGDRLVEGEYVPIQVENPDEEHSWGHSDVLGLDLCWENGSLRWHDPATQSYLLTHEEEAEGRIAAEARVRELEAQLRRLQGP